MIRVIELSYMIGSLRINGKPPKTLENQMEDILNNNKGYRYIDMKYKPQGNSVNMVYATLIVEAQE